MLGAFFMSKDFKAALKRVLKHEGGYVNDPRDTGGETNYGITKTTARSYGYTGSMKDIPVDVVERIYKAMYWDAMSCDSFHYAIAFQLFDAAVNHGLLNARKILQRAVGVKDDGMIGPVSLAAIRQQPVFAFVSLFNSKRISFYTNISNFNVYGKGWMNRMSENLRYVAEDMA